MYQPAAPPDQLALFGLSAVDLDDTVEVMPDVWPVFSLFEAMTTQWRAGMAGPTGLDYNAIPVTARMLGIKQRQARESFYDLRVMEAEALRVMREK